MPKYYDARQASFCPSRQVLHEYFADRLIHSALVMGYQPDKHFVAKMGALAWLNGAVAISNHCKYNDTRNTKRDFLHSTELSCSGFHALGRAATGWVDPMFPVRTEIERFYTRKRGASRLSIKRDADLPASKQILGEAALAGMLVREHYPFLNQILFTQKQYIEGQEAFMIRILNGGIVRHWPQPKHPMVELAEMCWDTSILLNDIIATSLARNLHLLLHLPNPWDETQWLQLGWKVGRLAGHNPSNLLSVYNHSCETMRDTRKCYRMVFDLCVIGTSHTAKKLNLKRAYRAYLNTWKPAVYNPAPVNLGKRENRSKHLRVVLVRGYYFAFIMGFLAQLDPAHGGFGGKLSATLPIK
jgi:hypothetical protein